jgi:hypothetical protein
MENGFYGNGTSSCYQKRFFIIDKIKPINLPYFTGPNYIFKGGVNIFYELPLKKLRRFRNFFTIKINSYSNRYKLIFLMTESYIKLLTARIKAFISLINLYFDKTDKSPLLSVLSYQSIPYRGLMIRTEKGDNIKWN